MPTPVDNPLLLRFGPFQLDAQAGELRKGDTLLHLAPQPCKVLAMLVSRPQKVFTRQEIQREIWGGDTFVDFEQGLNVAIRQIRAALCDDAETPRYIETLPRRGYRFIGRVEGNSDAAEGATPSVPSESAPHAAPRVPRHSSYRRRMTVMVGLGLAAVAVIFVWRMGRIAGRTPPMRIQSLAVLPLENLSHDAEQEYFADGMTDELITDLAKIHALRVISRNSMMQYKGKHKPTPQIARELNVDAIVEGTVMRSGDRVRITAQLIEAHGDRHLWAEAYEGDLRNVLVLQDEVAQDIAREVKATLNPQEQIRLTSGRPVNAEAYEAYLRGLYELHGMTAEASDVLKSESIEKAIGYFQQAIAYDHADALAYSGLADAYASLSTKYRAPLEVMPKAKAAAVKAIELDDTLAEAHGSLGYVELFFDWDWSRAEGEFRKALQLNSSLPRAHAGLAEYLLFRLGNSDEAIQELQRAYALDPLLPLSHGDLAWFSFLGRRYAESIEAAQRVGHDDHILALSYAELGRRDQALAAADRAVSSARNPVILSQIAAAYALAGRADKARAMVGGIEAQARERYVCGFNVACLYSVLGEKDQAFAWLEKAYRERSD
ncbi:MAG TPA: winged helix-turn-helix domain-containing protein [Candidatus Acidoferrum sp.]|nr:winged helix-turn-helix domain-containing protein [Candidatus Acidoferrum sp.]